MGDALAETFLGSLEVTQQERNSMDPAVKQAIEIISGILRGAVNAEGLQNINDCIQDSKIIVDDSIIAIKDFESKDVSKVVEGL